MPATRPEDRWIREALENSRGGAALRESPWTYEACGPKIGGNPERLERHVLIPHGAHPLLDAPRDREGLVAYFARCDVEGVVWWRDPTLLDCDKVKITGAALAVRRPNLPAPSER